MKRIILFVLLFVNPVLVSAQILTSRSSWTDWSKFVCTDGPGGTTLRRIAKFTGNPSTCVTATTSDTTGLLGISVVPSGTAGLSEIQTFGPAQCEFDGSTVAGDWIQPSTTTGGKCHDAGSSQPGSVESLGRVLSTNVGAGTYDLLVDVRPPATLGVMFSVSKRSGSERRSKSTIPRFRVSPPRSARTRS